MHETQQPLRGTSGKQADGGQIAPQLSEQIELAMRKIGDTVAIQVDRRRAIPVIAPAADGPFTRQVAAGRLDGMEVADEAVAGETLPSELSDT